jgi:GTP pyrophosphokinase
MHGNIGNRPLVGRLRGRLREGPNVSAKTLPRPLSSRFSDALTDAARLHAGQGRKGTDLPYVSHLLAVCAIALEHGATEDEAIAALLHDAIEDAPRSLKADGVRRWIRFRFGKNVLAIVEGCTDADKVPKPPWRERKQAYVRHVRTAKASVVLVSASDKLHNVRAILRDHRLVGDRVWARFKQAPKPKPNAVLGYYRGLVKAYRAGGHHHGLISELDVVVRELERATGVVGRWPLPRRQRR